MADAPAPRPHVHTPGSYLKARRCAARLSVAELAAKLTTDPRVPEHQRAEWLEQIEADVQPAAFATIAAIGVHVRLDLDALVRLDLIAAGSPELPPQLCRLCAGSPWMIIPEYLRWHEPDLCPVCDDGFTMDAGARERPLRSSGVGA